MTYFLKYVMTIDNCAASVYKIQIAQITCFLWHCCKTSIETPLSKNVHAWRFVNSFSILVACFDNISGMNVRYVKLFVYARNIKINIANQSFCWKSMKYWGDWRKICTSVFYCKIYGYLQTQNDFVLQNFWYLASLIQFTKCHQNSKVRGNLFASMIKIFGTKPCMQIGVGLIEIKGLFRMSAKKTLSKCDNLAIEQTQSLVFRSFAGSIATTKN